MHDTNEEVMRGYLRVLRTEYANALPAKLQALEATWRLLHEYGWEATHMHDLHRQIHRIHGSGAMYGFASLSGAAQPIDVLVGTLSTRDTSPNANEVAELTTRMEALRASISECMHSHVEEPVEL